MAFELSEYQKNIIHTFNTTSDNLFISALAGSAKTFTLLKLAENTNKYSVFLAFNKSIQDEIQEKLNNSKFKVYTFNKLGYAIMRNAWDEWTEKNSKLTELTIDVNKNYKILSNMSNIIDPLVKGKDVEEKYSLLGNLSMLWDFCRNKSCNYHEIENVMKIINFYDLFCDCDLPHNIVDILEEMNNQDIKIFKEQGIIDFIDQLYLTLYYLQNKEWKIKPWFLFQNIFVDECLPGNVYINCKKGNNEELITLFDLYELYLKNKELPLVKSYNHSLNKYEYKKILNVKKHNLRKTYEITTYLGNKIRATDNHKFCTENGYKQVKELIPNVDKFCIDISNFSIESEGVKIENPLIMFDYVKDIKESDIIDVFDIEVQDNHNFICYNNKYSMGILSHNCQDLNRLQQIFLYYIKRNKDTRLIFAGDKNQAIYSFAGADSHSYENIQKMYNTIELRLPINYRCPISHLDYVNRKFLDIGIEAAPNAKKGIIKNIEWDEIFTYIKPGNCIISRTNRDLCIVAIELLQNKFSIYIQNAELVTNLINIVKKQSKKVHSVDQLKLAIQDQKEQLLEKLQLKEMKEEESNEKNPIKNVSDNIIDLYDCVNILLNHYIEKNGSDIAHIDNFIKYIEKMLNTKDPRNCVECTTIHKAKGKEYDVVFLLNRGRIMYELGQTADQKQQEANLSYIALTRSKHTLFLVSPYSSEE